MRINRMKLEKLRKDGVLFEGNVWDLVEVFKPTKYDTYLLVKRVRTDQVHPESNGINPVDMRLIDIDNNEFYPNTEKAREIVFAIKAKRESLEAMDRVATQIWLSVGY